MDCYWTVEDETLQRLMTRYVWVDAIDAALTVAALALFGAGPVVVGIAVCLVARVVQVAVHCRRHPVHMAAKAVCLRLFIAKGERLGRAGYRPPLWQVLLMLPALPTRVFRALFGGPPSLTTFVEPLHARVLDGDLFVYDAAALARGAEIPRWGRPPVPLAELHALPHDRGVVRPAGCESGGSSSP